MHNGADKTHLCVHKHIVSCRFSEQLPEKPFQQSGSPLVSHSKGVSGSQDFRSFSQNQCQTLSFPQYIQSLTQTGISSFVSPATINGPFRQSPVPPRRPKKSFHHSVFIVSRLCCLLFYWGMKEVKGSHTRAQRGRKEMAVNCERGARAL